MSHGEFLAGQFCYIEKWVWVLSGMLMLFIIWACSRNTGNYPFALTPLLAVGILAETRRSYRWKMAELEYAARFSLRSIVLARMFLVGFIDTAGLLIVTFAVRSYLTYSLIRVFLYMMVPYLLAAFLGSLYERKKRTDAGLGSLVICTLSSAVFAAAPIFMSSLYEESLTIIWATAFILLICSLAVSVREQMREMEEPIWN
jgi:ABC-type nitrate/sulfonate/bicarbonate transport system permease component